MKTEKELAILVLFSLHDATGEVEVYWAATWFRCDIKHLPFCHVFMMTLLNVLRYQCQNVYSYKSMIYHPLKGHATLPELGSYWWKMVIKGHQLKELSDKQSMSGQTAAVIPPLPRE